jgi:hypothetical protein
VEVGVKSVDVTEDIYRWRFAAAIVDRMVKSVHPMIDGFMAGDGVRFRLLGERRKAERETRCERKVRGNNSIVGETL